MALGLMAATTYAAGVTTWTDLQEALEYGGSVVLGADITSGDGDETLVVPEGKQVTLNLNGCSIRFFPGSGENRQAAVRNEGTLDLVDSTGDGGIFMDSSATQSNVIINKGTLMMSDVTIGMKSSTEHDVLSVWNEQNAVLTVTDGAIAGFVRNEGVVNLSGNIVLSEGVILENADPIHIVGLLGEEAWIKVAVPGMEDQPGTYALPMVVTDGLGTYGDPKNFGSAFPKRYGMDINEGGEAYLDYMYTVSFDSVGGSAVADKLVMNDHPVDKPDDPTRDNMVFRGWWLDGEPYDFAAPVTGNITLVAKWITPWAELQEKLDQGGTVKLDADVKAQYGDAALVVPKDVSVTLDLNGHTIDRNGAAANSDRNPAIQIFGELTLEDSSADSTGKITGADNVYQGGGVANYGSFTLAGGTITENEAIRENGSTPQGGVCNKGTFTMTRGKISENHSHEGGDGVYNDRIFEMSGGTITGNETKSAGGGVCNEGTFTITGGIISDNFSELNMGDGVYTKGIFRLSGSGKPLIYHNTEDMPTDVYLAQGCCMNVVGEPDPSITYGVAMEEPGVITSGLSGNGGAENFFAQYVGGEAQGWGVDLTDDGEAEIVKMFLVTFYAYGDDSQPKTIGTQYVRPGHTVTPLTVNEATDAPSLHNGNVVFGGWERIIPETEESDEEAELFDFDTPVESDLDLYAKWISRWADFQKKLNAGGELTLTRNFDAWDVDDSLVIPEGVTVELDLNGHTLYRSGSADALNRTPAIVVRGTLTLKDGSADGSVKITGADSTVPGGGVYVAEGGTFTMLGGTITGNSAEQGSGVYNRGYQKS